MMTTTARKVVVVLAVVVELMLGLVGGGCLRLECATDEPGLGGSNSEREDGSECVRRVGQKPSVEARADKARLLQTRCGTKLGCRVGGQKKTRQLDRLDRLDRPRPRCDDAQSPTFF